MMKKTYINPTTTEYKIDLTSSMLLDISMTRDSTDGNKLVDSNQILVKGDRGSREVYNVWNDDWSK